MVWMKENPKKDAEQAREQILQQDRRELDERTRADTTAAGHDTAITLQLDGSGNPVPGQLNRPVDITEHVNAQRVVTNERVQLLIDQLAGNLLS